MWWNTLRSIEGSVQRSSGHFSQSSLSLVRRMLYSMLYIAAGLMPENSPGLCGL